MEEATPYVASTQSEYKDVGHFLTRQGGLAYVWMGCDDEETERTFDCFGGTQILESSPWWKPGQPNEYRTENCVVYVVNEKKIHDWYCSFAGSHAVCEKSVQ
ncbi:mannose-binding protein-like [Diadema setosum]|uniref:mannose-binding protein-like n=1 Tax=Diadema setosum TaxID=31175 RepID=UPI003B3AEAC2